MMEQEDVLFRPIMRGFYKFESLLDGTLDLAHVMLCNEAIDIEQENTLRHAAYERAQVTNHSRSR